VSRRLQILYAPEISLDRDLWPGLANAMSHDLYVSLSPDSDADPWTKLTHNDLPSGERVTFASSSNARTPSFRVSPGADECLLGEMVPTLRRLDIDPLDDGHLAFELAHAARRILDGVLLVESGPVIVGRDELEKSTLAEALASRRAEDDDADDDAEISVDWSALANTAKFTLIVKCERSFSFESLVAHFPERQFTGTVGSSLRWKDLELIEMLSGAEFRIARGPSKADKPYYARLRVTFNADLVTSPTADEQVEMLRLAKELLAALRVEAGAFVIDVESALPEG
jgi:hypothetical protein